jgi:hypothetical protein
VLTDMFVVLDLVGADEVVAGDSFGEGFDGV